MRIVSVAAGRFAGQFIATDEDGMTFKGRDVKWANGRFIEWEGREYADPSGKTKQDGTPFMKTAPAIGYQSKEHEAQMNDHIFALLDQMAQPAPQRQAQRPAAQPAASGFGRTPAPADGHAFSF